MLASIFAIQGFDTLLRPERVAATAEPVVRPVAERVEQVYRGLLLPEAA